MICTACQKNLTGIADCCKSAQGIKAENAKLTMLLARYGRHDSACEQSVLEGPNCECGWEAVALEYLEE
jgi:hypothetical protein